MLAVSLFDEIAAERRVMADLLEGLSDEQLETPSLCGQWTVRDVGAHLVMPLVTPVPRVVLAMLRCGGNFNRANVALTARIAQQPASEIAAQLRQRATSRFTPPRHDASAPLSEILIHGQDVRRPLGITREIDPHRLRVSLDMLMSPRARLGFVPKGRLDGLRLHATDFDWSAGSGAEVDGPGEALLMAMAGRHVALADLSGDGVAVLAART
jgi:uncharacterized protein (TIGR03083 family)